MYFLGFAALARASESATHRAYLETLVGGRINVGTAIDEMVVTGGTTKLFAIPGTPTPTIDQLLTKVAWTEMNLFIGPAGIYRDDDPSQRNDKLPKGMPETTKTALKEVMTTIKSFSSSLPHVTGSGGDTQCARMSQKAFENITNTFLDKIKVTPRTYDSKVSDWYIKIGKDCRRVFITRGAHTVRSDSPLLQPIRGQPPVTEGRFMVDDIKPSPDIYYKVISAESAKSRIQGRQLKRQKEYDEQQDLRIRDCLM